MSWSVFERLVIILVSMSSTSELVIEDLTLSLDEGEARTDRTIDLARNCYGSVSEPSTGDRRIATISTGVS